MNRIAASILAADFSRLAEEVAAVEAAGVDWIHIDVMDGHFVPNLTVGPLVVEALRPRTRLPIDVHLMIEHPERILADFVRAGADYISVHQETCPHLHGVLQQIRKLGARPGVVINPATPLALVEPVLADVDLLLVMSVNPGFGGQTFIESSLARLAAAKRFRDERQLDFLIEVDGGVKIENAARVAAAGAEVFVVGTGIFATRDYPTTVRSLREAVGITSVPDARG